MPKEEWTSQLGSYFGPKRAPTGATVAQPTACPWAPEHLRPLLDWFTETTSILPRTTADKRYQVKAASGFYEEFGSDTKLADKAYRVLRKNRYIVSSLDSLRKTARGLKVLDKEETDEERRDKYTRGWFDG